MHSDRVEPVWDDETVREFYHFEDSDTLPKEIQACIGTLYNVGPNRWVFFEDEE
jgi:hypothetical protein